MKHILVIFLLFLLPIITLKAQDYAHKPGYNLVWFDEFDDSIKTFAQWDTRYPWGPWAGGLMHYAQPNCHIFNNGKLDLALRKGKVSGEVYAYDSAGNFAPYFRDFDYSGGMLYSKQAFKHGFFEAKFRSDAGKGFHNAFWLYGEEDAEIDVFEIYGSRPERAQMTLHWRGKDPITNSAQSFTYINANPSFSADYHTFAVAWDSTKVDWYLDQQLVRESNFTNFIRGRHIPKVPLNIIVNAGITGFDGDPDSTTPFPSFISFDYVRAYQQTPVAAPQILNHKPKQYDNYNPISIQLEDLIVSDHYQTYPFGFALELLPGENYAVVNNKLLVNQGFNKDIYLNLRVFDGIKYSNTYQFVISPSALVSIDKLANAEQNFMVFPNPSSGMIKVLLDQATYGSSLAVYSASGQMLLHLSNVSNNEIIDLSAYPNGLYAIVYRDLNKGISQSKLLNLNKD